MVIRRQILSNSSFKQFRPSLASHNTIKIIYINGMTNGLINLHIYVKYMTRDSMSESSPYFHNIVGKNEAQYIFCKQ